MNTLEHLRELFIFNDWANRKLIGSLVENDCVRACTLAVHLLVTEKEYFDRLGGKDSTGFNFWPDLSIEQCDEIRRENTKYYLELLDGLDEDDLEITLHYKTSEGVDYENSYREMLTHVLFHSMTHRGQSLSAIRADGGEPPDIDYIIYRREY